MSMNLIFLEVCKYFKETHQVKVDSSVLLQFPAHSQHFAYSHINQDFVWLSTKNKSAFSYSSFTNRCYC